MERAQFHGRYGNPSPQHAHAQWPLRHGAFSSRDTSPAVLRSSSSTRSLATATNGAGVLGACGGGGAPMPLPTGSNTASIFGGPFAHDGAQAAFQQRRRVSLANSQHRQEPAPWTPPYGATAETAALMARVQSVSAKAETLLVSAGRTGAGRGKPVGTTRMRGARVQERPVGLEEGLGQLEVLLDEVATLGPLASAPVPKPILGASPTARPQRQSSGVIMPDGPPQKVNQAGSHTPTPPTLRTDQRLMEMSQAAGSYRAPPPTSRPSNRFVEIMQVPVATVMTGPAAQQQPVSTAFNAAGGPPQQACGSGPVASGRLTPPTPMPPPAGLGLTGPLAGATPMAPAGSGVPGSRTQSPIRSGRPPPPACGAAPASQSQGHAPRPRAGTPQPPMGWFQGHPPPASSQPGGLATAPPWLGGAGQRAPMSHRSFTPRAASGLDTPRVGYGTTGIGLFAHETSVVRGSSATRGFTPQRRAPSAPPSRVLTVVPPPVVPMPLPMSAVGPGVDGLTGLGDPPPPLAGLQPLSHLALGPLPGLGGHWMPPLAKTKQDGVEAKIRQWLQTIPIGNGADRGWDDGQIAEITEFARRKNLGDLDAETIYKKYVEDQVERAEAEG
mmetsp:Transcript_17631/g.48414  ORF Transcript_17631/g.48414 Transcript_17631/m.48414 type:complete len:612 (+) Transcript_17631:75-1910(+)